MSEPVIHIDQLMDVELKALEGTDRLDRKNGVVLPAPKSVATIPKLSPSEIPPIPEGVAERIKATKAVESSYVLKEGAKVALTSDDKGTTAEKTAVDVINPDWAEKPKEDPIDFEDKKLFLAHILGAEFRKTYTLFNGHLKVTFRVMTEYEQKQCVLQTMADDEIDGIQAKPGSDAATKVKWLRLSNYQLCGALAEIRRGPDIVHYKPFETPSNKEARETAIRAAWTKLEMETSSTVMAAIRSCNNKFTELTARLTLAAHEPDFWNPVTAN